MSRLAGRLSKIDYFSNQLVQELAPSVHVSKLAARLLLCFLDWTIEGYHAVAACKATFCPSPQRGTSAPKMQSALLVLPLACTKL